jgi:Zn-dependent M28 family amino/carboxypeptidase
MAKNTNDRSHIRGFSIAVMALTVALAVAAPVLADPAADTEALRQALTVEGVRAHQAALQAIADANGGTRVASTPGYDGSADYVAAQLVDAGYAVTIQAFDFPFFQELTSPTLEQVNPNPTFYPPNDPAGFQTMMFSGSGDVTALVQSVDVLLPPGPTANTSTSGCEPADFGGFTAGNVALVQRGTCTFQQKALNAQAAGATGMIVFNEGQPGREAAFGGTLSQPGVTIPVVASSFAVGEELHALSGVATVRLVVETISEFRSSSNVLADTPGGRENRVVVVGAHLDSVASGPGINDNGSGAATILEIALQMSDLGIAPRNKVRFAWWGAEESGLVGSEFYVSQLSDRELKRIALNLNIHMVGSPNFVRFVLDGDGSETSLRGPRGSGSIERVFRDYFADQGLATSATPLNGRSSYWPFLVRGVPVGGLFGGAEGIKTEEEVAIYGGTAGFQYDPCYHLACDTFDNVSLEALDQLADAAAHATLVFAMTRASLSGTAQGKGLGLGGGPPGF